MWGIDILGPFTPAAQEKKFVIVAIDYFTKWVEAEPLMLISEEKVEKSLSIQWFSGGDTWLFSTSSSIHSSCIMGYLLKAYFEMLDLPANETFKTKQNRKKIGPITWSSNEVVVLFTFMVDNIRSGNKTDATFNKNGWDDIHTRLEATLGRVFDREQIRNKFNKMRIVYGSFKPLLQLTGFGWNSITNTVTVDDDSVWDKVIAVNSGLKKFRHQGLSQWHELQIIFGDSYACGYGGVDNTQDWVTTAIEDLEVDEEISTPFHDTPIGLDNLQVNEVGEGIHTSTYNQDRTLTAKRKQSAANNLSSALGYVGKLYKMKIEKVATSTEATSALSRFSTTAFIDTSVLDCIGAIDGSHISAIVPKANATRYRNRKGITTQNVMCICDFEIRFTYVYAGWEGNANDCRIFEHARRHPALEFPHPPEGKYYVVDFGYANQVGYLTPFRGESYHIPDYQGAGRTQRLLKSCSTTDIPHLGM
ncbi:uncharacterized protein LOC122650740 [Telopea speciosissima]|uniref:uncharacterized protein LOC122650740 n=1 Tax=Telopea speciosissima TaxID=54955 RepID=UPI001CC4F6F0|nr:uncharacterized protein LOC122650740 [Telopea speciosissima]